MTESTQEKAQPNQTQEIYSINEAAKYLRISRVTLYRIRESGKISFRRIGAGRIVFTQNDLKEYLKRQKTNAHAA